MHRRSAVRLRDVREELLGGDDAYAGTFSRMVTWEDVELTPFAAHPRPHKRASLQVHVRRVRKGLCPRFRSHHPLSYFFLVSLSTPS